MLTLYVNKLAGDNRWSAPPRMPPLRFFVHGVVGDAAQGTDRAAVDAGYCRMRDSAPGGSSMNGMNLSGKPGMVQPMQMPPTLGQPPMPRHPAALGNVAVDHRSPAADLDDALGRAVFLGEIALLVIAGAVAAFVHGLAEQPCRAAADRRAESWARGRPLDTADRERSP